MSRPKAETLYEVLKYRAETQPNDSAYIFLENGEDESYPMTYSQLHESSKAFAAKLQSLNLSGERALLIFESDYNYIISFFACIYAGVISVPLHPPGKNKSMSRISAIANDSGAKVILSTHELCEELKHDSDNDPVLKSLEWILIDEQEEVYTDNWTEPKLGPESITYLQYTSGSTGIPKGVIVSHGNLVTNLTIIDKSHPHSEHSVMVTWLPIHHDMGLIYGMLLPFFCGYPCYFMTPQAFVQKPYRWLHAISKYRGTHNAAPNFAFELCANKISQEEKKNLDLSSWTVAMNAAEPVRAETLTRFTEYFADCGFRFDHFKPGYGLAEGTLILSTTFKDSFARMVRFNDEQLEKFNRAVNADVNDHSSKIHVGHSHSIEDTRIAIVNPVTLVECPEGEVGEVWAKGNSIAKGYWMREDATTETFRAHIAGTNEGPFLRTGDLGFIKDDELYITGRHKDLIIIRGQNHYPQDIEYTVEASHPSLRLGCVAAFPVEENGEELIGIVQEVQKNSEADLDSEQVFKSIRTAVSNVHDLQISSVTLIKAQTIPKTSSGKIQRRACKEGYLNGTLSVVAQWKQGDADKSKPVHKQDGAKLTEVSDKKIREFILKRLSEMMKIAVENIDPAEAFSAYGMDSLKAVQLSGELEEFLNAELPSTLVYDYPNIDALSDYLTGKRKATGRIISAAKKKEKEPVAIVGIGLRFPGGNSNTEQFYKFLISGGDAIRQIPEGRWNNSQLKENTVTLGGFLDDVEMFDAAFFGISPREALQIDPQQRMALEVAWEALEDACIDPSSLAGKNVGVFMGVCSYDYARFTSGRKEFFDVYTGTGTSLSIVANRISYLLDFRGPSLAIDTACSSSLVALHTACQSLNSGESSLALAGGVNLLLNPDWNVVFTEADMLAPDGHCKTFDAKADGYVRSEGCGVIVLKRLNEALSDGDRIYAVISGSAINQDGKSNGLTAPNGPSQVDVIRRALNDAGISGDEIGYIEAHGTGTPLGDPIEFNSITEALEVNSRNSGKLHVGSVKTNIGHLEAAAGIAGVIKTSLGFHYGKIPQQINFNSVNPEIKIDGVPAAVATEQIVVGGNLKYAGISSFGFGGTNSHVILSPAPQRESAGEKNSRPSSIVTLSAKSEKALDSLAAEFVRYIELNKDVSVDDVSFSANTGREAMSHRLAVTGASVEDILRGLRMHSDADAVTNIVRGHARHGHSPKTAFLFPGQGAQYTGMGKELYETIPSFRDDINRCNEMLKDHLPVSLLEVLYDESEESMKLLDMTRYTQPALFAVEYALGRLWMSWGIVPDVMMGHSAGEYVAACLAGVFSLEDGLKLTAERGRLMEELTASGEMYTVFANATVTADMLKGFEDRVSIASMNSPEKTVISGDADAVRKIVEALDMNNVEYRKINVSIASHSPLMKPMIGSFRNVCNSVRYSRAKIPVVSNITAEITSDMIADADYWCRHILSPVEFSKSISACVQHGITHFVDLGPKPTSLSMAQECVDSSGLTWIPSFKKNFTAWQILNEGLARLYAEGANVDWNGYHSPFAGRKLSVPGYPFQRQRYWIADQTSGADASLSGGMHTGRVLLGAKLNTSSRKHFIFNSRISANEPAYLAGHKVFGKAVFPGAGFTELMLSAAESVFNLHNIRLEKIKFHSPLFLNDDSFASIQTSVNLTTKDKAHIEICSLEKDGNNSSWKLHASAKATALKPGSRSTSSFNPVIEKGRNIFVNGFYDTARKEGIDYSGAFRGLNQITEENDIVSASAELPLGEQTSGYCVHPAMLDMGFQAALAVLLNARHSVYVPASAESILFLRNPGTASRIAARRSAKGGALSNTFDISVYDEQNVLCLEVKKLRLASVEAEELLGVMPDDQGMLYELLWRESEEKGYSGSSFDPKKLIRMQSKPGSLIKHVTDIAALEEYGSEIDSVEESVAFYILDALRNSGIDVRGSSSYTTDKLASLAGVSERHKKLFMRLLELLEGRGIVRRSGTEISFNDDAGIVLENGPAVLNGKKFSKASHEMAFVKQCGERLKDVLTEKLEALDVLFPGGDFTNAAAIYRDSPAFSVMNHAVRKITGALYHSVKSGRKIRILEIGAGTGSTAVHALHELKAGKAEYVFTDISAAFFEKAKELLAEKSFVEFKTLDIENDPESQGFEPESFDLVIASNVIHATKDLRASLANIRKLLRKGGAIILNEATEKRAWIDLTFGMTEGWWRFEDGNLRKAHPLLDREQWRGLLDKSGFENIFMLSPESEEGKQHTGQNLIVATKDCSADEPPHLVNLVLSFLREDETLKEELVSLGGECVIATNAKEFKVVSEGTYRISLESEEQLKRLFEEECVIGAGALNVFFIAGASPDSLFEGTLQQCSALLNTVKCLKRSGIRGTLRLVTRDALCINENDKLAGLSASALWGFGKVIDIEHPELSVRILDTDEATPVAEVLSEISSGHIEKFSAFRKGRKFVPRMKKARPAPKHYFFPKKNFAYLITGGLSGIGLLCAKMLADLGARNIIVAGRRGTTPEAEALKDELLQRRVKLFTVKADVSRVEDVEYIFDAAEEAGVKIKGIIHSAGLLDDAVVMNQTPEKFRNVLEPKVLGAINLYNRTKKSGLQFFDMLSSVASVFGSAGQANHSSANSFLDSFSKYIHSKGLNATGINLGVWSGIGSAAERGADRQEKIPGLETITPDEGMGALRKVFDTGLSQVGIFRMNWSRYYSVTGNSLSADLAGEVADNGADAEVIIRKETLAEKLSHTEEKDQTEILQEYFKNLISSIMGLEPEDIEPDIPLSSMGLDSLMAIELKNKVNLELGVNLNLVRYMEETDINQLSKELREQIPELLKRAGKNDAEVPPADVRHSDGKKARDILADLDNLSEEELDKLLKEMN